jgi:prepilin-type N-terminal cleavage/methylation domain-containing protein
MRRVSRGYTIIEVTIVLAISGVILASAMLMLRGQQGKTEFTQSMRDIDSKIQSIAKDTASGVSSTIEKKCSIGTDERPSLSADGSSDVGTNSECIFLGKAIEVNGSDTVKIYTVLGKRDASSFSDANPTFVGSVESYPLIGGSTVLSSKTSDLSGASTQDSSLVGMYLGGMSGSDSDSGSAGGPLFLRAYKQSSGGECIEEGSGCGVMEQVGKWTICFQSAYDSSTRASLIITPSSSGVTTQLNFDGCT